MKAASQSENAYNNYLKGVFGGNGYGEFSQDWCRFANKILGWSRLLARRRYRHLIQTKSDMSHRTVIALQPAVVPTAISFLNKLL